MKIQCSRVYLDPGTDGYYTAALCLYMELMVYFPLHSECMPLPTVQGACHSLLLLQCQCPATNMENNKQC